MKSDSKSLQPAEVDTDRILYFREKDIEIDFRNEIDAWAQMEFHHRGQIRHHKKYGKFRRSSDVRDGTPVFYSTRQGMDDEV